MNKFFVLFFILLMIFEIILFFLEKINIISLSLGLIAGTAFILSVLLSYKRDDNKK